MNTLRALTASLIFLASCAAPPPPAEKAKTDPTKEPAYAEAVKQLAAINRDAADLFQRGRKDDAAARITRGLPLQARLLEAPRPTLEAMEAVSDLDDLYGRTLLSSGNHGWARMLFQKNVVRWKYWEPQTEETARRMKQAEAGIAECDRLMR